MYYQIKTPSTNYPLGLSSTQKDLIKCQPQSAMHPSVFDVKKWKYLRKVNLKNHPSPFQKNIQNFLRIFVTRKPPLFLVSCHVLGSLSPLYFFCALLRWLRNTRTTRPSERSVYSTATHEGNLPLLFDASILSLLPSRYENVFRRIAQEVRHRYPQIQVTGGNYPPTEAKQFLSNILRVVQVAVVVLALAGEAIFSALGMREPEFYCNSWG